MTGRGVVGAVIAAVLAPLVLAYALLPGEVVALWPLVALSLVPGAVVLIAAVPYHVRRATSRRDLGVTAAAWLAAAIERLGIEVTVAALAHDRHRHRDFYHHATRTIVLSEHTLGDRSPSARAVAAHELGHALVYERWPRLARVLRWCRRRAGAVWSVGNGLLVGVALVGGAELTTVALALVGVGVALYGVIVVDEVLATRLAIRQLAGAATRAGVVDLILALGAYAAQAVAMAWPVVAWPALADRFGDGVLVAEAPLTGALAVTATVTGVVVLVGLVAQLWSARTRTPGLVGVLAIPALIVMPLFVVLTVTQPAALDRGWVVAVAAGPAAGLLMAPPALVLAALDRRVRRGVLRALGPPVAPFGLADVRRIAPGDLADREPADGVLTRLWLCHLLGMVAPLAGVHLGLW